MILIRLLNTPVRVGFTTVTGGVRADKFGEKFAFTTATIFACFGIGMSTMGLTQLSHYRNTHKIV